MDRHFKNKTFFNFSKKSLKSGRGNSKFVEVKLRKFGENQSFREQLSNVTVVKMLLHKCICGNLIPLICIRCESCCANTPAAKKIRIGKQGIKKGLVLMF